MCISQWILLLLLRRVPKFWLLTPSFFNYVHMHVMYKNGRSHDFECHLQRWMAWTIMKLMCFLWFLLIHMSWFAMSVSAVAQTDCQAPLLEAAFKWSVILLFSQVCSFWSLSAVWNIIKEFVWVWPFFLDK